MPIDVTTSRDELNARQQTYLLTIYTVNHTQEQDERAAGPVAGSTSCRAARKGHR
jgi:hypothetical protein